MGYDHVIVGGGIYGTATAWELARRGADVLVLEREEVACGASGGPGKRGVRANGRDPRELPLARRAYDLWPRLAERIDSPTGYERTGHLLLIEKRMYRLGSGLHAAPARIDLQQRAGIPTDLIEGERLRELEPNLDDRVRAAVHCPMDGVADHGATTRGLASAAERAGATVWEGTGLDDVVLDGDRATGVVTDDGERVSVDGTVLVLSNTHVPEFLEKRFGLSLPVSTMLPQVVLTEPVDPVPVRHLIGHDHRTLALKAVGDRVMISGGWMGRWTDDGVPETVPEHVEGNVAAARAIYPALETVGIDTADASRAETASVDGVPVIDTVPSAENVLFATGWTGHGFAIAPAVAELLAEWAVDGSRPELLRPFGLDRFEFTVE